MKLFCARTAKDNMGTARRVQLDYLKSVLLSGHVYSVPDVSSAVLQAAAALARPAEAAEHLERGASDGSMLFFRVLDTGIGNKKLLPTSGAATSMRGMDWPVQIQRYSVQSSYDVLYPAPRYEVYADADPVIVELPELAPWPVLRLALREWSEVQSQVPGCLSLQASFTPQPLLPPPALVCLETLFEAGWVDGKPPPFHTATTPKVFRPKDPVHLKPYLHCLLRLQDICALEGPGVPSRALLKVYTGLLKRLPAGQWPAGPVIADPSVEEQVLVAAEPRPERHCRTSIL